MDSKPILAMNAFDPGAPNSLEPALAERVQQQTRLFGAASVLFYDRPLEFVRGAGCWLYDADGVAYLDAYNNVPSVGHAHPTVVDAVTRQLGRLNINSRYLHPGVDDYAERLLSTLPPPLSNVVFTCTGSESNDLALRLAAQFTRARGVVVTESAYHGNTALVTDASPSVFKQPLRTPQVRVVPAPDPSLSPERMAAIFAADVSAAIADLERSGVGFAALLLDGIFSSDGVVADPPGFLRPAVAAAHRARGLFIADEVQCGFGRTGASLWGFDRHGVAPDLVTLGKPMGNGYPMGAVVTRPDILETFCTRVGYFNTFGGSPVAAAAGNAVLDVIRTEGLMENARRVGEHLKRGLETLATRHREIAGVRGAGLYVGVDLVQHPAATPGPAPTPGCAPTPAPALARAVINALRDRRVLIGAAGKYGNVLKIRPPLCFSVANADQLLGALHDALTHCAGGEARRSR